VSARAWFQQCLTINIQPCSGGGSDGTAASEAIRALLGLASVGITDNGQLVPILDKLVIDVIDFKSSQLTMDVLVNIRHSELDPSLRSLLSMAEVATGAACLTTGVGCVANTALGIVDAGLTWYDIATCKRDCDQRVAVAVIHTGFASIPAITKPIREPFIDESAGALSTLFTFGTMLQPVGSSPSLSSHLDIDWTSDEYGLVRWTALAAALNSSFLGWGLDDEDQRKISNPTRLSDRPNLCWNLLLSVWRPCLRGSSVPVPCHMTSWRGASTVVFVNNRCQDPSIC
jgi:hypothetical protein